MRTVTLYNVVRIKIFHKVNRYREFCVLANPLGFCLIRNLTFESTEELIFRINNGKYELIRFLFCIYIRSMDIQKNVRSPVLRAGAVAEFTWANSLKYNLTP